MSFNKHELSERHKSSIDKWNLYLNVQLNQKSVANELIHSRNKEIVENRKQVHFLLKATLFLSKRGLAFRGHDEATTSLNKGNFMDLIEMFGDEKLKEQLQSKVKYGHLTSHSVQNELISVIATCTR